MVNHLSPPCRDFFIRLTHGSSLRWGLIPSASITPEDSLSWSDLTIVPASLYLAWQLGFFFMTEFWFAERLAADPTLITSVR